MIPETKWNTNHLQLASTCGLHESDFFEKSKPVSCPRSHQLELPHHSILMRWERLARFSAGKQGFPIILLGGGEGVGWSHPWSLGWGGLCQVSLSSGYQLLFVITVGNSCKNGRILCSSANFHCKLLFKEDCPSPPRNCPPWLPLHTHGLFLRPGELPSRTAAASFDAHMVSDSAERRPLCWLLASLDAPHHSLVAPLLSASEDALRSPGTFPAPVTISPGRPACFPFTWDGV